MIPTTTTVVLSVLVCSPQLVSSIACYQCHNCSPDKHSSVEHGCSKCQTTQGIMETRVNRLCLTSKRESQLAKIGVDTNNGCNNISIIPGVSDVKLVCFCSSELCNTSVRQARLFGFLWLLPVIFLLFK